MHWTQTEKNLCVKKLPTCYIIIFINIKITLNVNTKKIMCRNITNRSHHYFYQYQNYVEREHKNLCVEVLPTCHIIIFINTNVALNTNNQTFVSKYYQRVTLLFYQHQHCVEHEQPDPCVKISPTCYMIIFINIKITFNMNKQNYMSKYLQHVS